MERMFMVNSLPQMDKLTGESETPGREAEKIFLFEEDEGHFIQALREHATLTSADASKLNLILKSGQTEFSVMQLILNLGMASEADLLEHLSKSLGLRIIAADSYPDELYGEHLFNKKFLREQSVVVVSETDQFIEICINDPFGHDLNSALSFAIGDQLLKIRLGYKKDISDALDLVLLSGEDRELAEKFDAGDAVLL
jgi:hypothetical protein